MPQKGDVKDALMRLPVGADQTGAVNADKYIRVLAADVMDDLIVRPLQKGRINRKKRLHALERHSSRHRRRMLFCDSDIKHAFREFFRKPFQFRADRHGRCNGDNSVILARQLLHGAADKSAP